jgi:hypothetical protein
MAPIWRTVLGTQVRNTGGDVELGDSAARLPDSLMGEERWARGVAPPSFEGFALIGASLFDCEALPAGGGHRDRAHSWATKLLTYGGAYRYKVSKENIHLRIALRRSRFGRFAANVHLVANLRISVAGRML